MSRRRNPPRQPTAPQPGARQSTAQQPGPRHAAAPRRTIVRAAPPPPWTPWLIPTAIVLATLVTFEQTLRNDFVGGWDDSKNLLDNPSYRGLGWPQLQWMFTAFHVGHYMPLTWMTLGLDYLVWGMNPVGYHLTNLLLHTASAVFVYFVACRLLAAALPVPAQRSPTALALCAAAAALLFALHPLRVESVAWATERRDVLSGFFFLATILASLRFPQ